MTVRNRLTKHIIFRPNGPPGSSITKARSPPYTEGVLWYVLKEPLTLSKEQIEAFRKLYHGNSRAVQAALYRALKAFVN